jgi:hypothetical protein
MKPVMRASLKVRGADRQSFKQKEAIRRGISIEVISWQCALPDDGGERSARDFFSTGRHDHGVPAFVAIFEVTAALRDESEAARVQDFNDLAELSNLAINDAFAHEDFVDLLIRSRWRVFKIEFDGFLEIGNRLLDALAEAGDIDVETLGHVIGLLLIHAEFYGLYGSECGVRCDLRQPRF